jgi:hypothetical protein
LFTEGTPLSQPIPFQVVVTAGKVLIVTLVEKKYNLSHWFVLIHVPAAKVAKLVPVCAATARVIPVKV